MPGGMLKLQFDWHISSEQLACCRTSEQLVTGSKLPGVESATTEIRTLRELGLPTFIVRNVAFLLRLFWVKKEEITVGRKASRASKSKPPSPHPLSSRSVSATAYGFGHLTTL